MTKKIENVIKTALLNGKDFQSDNGWLIRINASDNVEIWNPKGAGVETSLTFLDKAIKDFCKKADVYAPAVNQTQGKPSKVTDGELGKDTSTKDTKKLDAPEKSPRPKPKGPFTPTSLGGDTSVKPGFSDPAVNKRPKQKGNPGGTELGPDSSGKGTNWGDKVVKVKSDGRTGKITDTFSSGPDPSEIYRNLMAKRPSKEMLEDIMDPEKWVANRVFAQMQENKPKRGPGMPGKGKGTYADGDAGGQLGAGCEAEGEVDKKKSPKTAGPKLREKWLNDGGYHREIESESAEELHALVQGFNNEDVDWSKFKPVMPEKDAEGAEGVDPQAQAPTPATQTAKRAEKTKIVEIGFSEQAAGDWGENQANFQGYLKNMIESALEDAFQFSDEIDFRVKVGGGEDYVRTKGFTLSQPEGSGGDEQTLREDVERLLGNVWEEANSTFDPEPPANHYSSSKKAQFDDDSDWETNPEYWAESYINGNKSDVVEAAYSGKVDPEQIYMTLKDLDPSAADSFATSLFKRIPSHVGKKAQSAEVEAVDEDAKDVITKYMGDYGKELTKDDGVAPKKADPKNKVKKGQAQEPAPAPAAPQAPAPKAPVAPGAPAAPAPGAPKAPGGQQSLQPGVGDAGIQALGWTKEDVQTMTDEQKQGILKIKLTKPGTQPKTQAPPQQKAPAPKAPTPQAPAAPGGEAAPTPAPGSEPAPPAPATPAPKAVKGGKSRKRSQAAPQAPVEEAPAPVAPAPQAPAQKAPAAPQANPTTKPGAGSDGSTEEQAFKILQEVQKQDVEASSANEISTAKASILIQRLMQEIGMGANEAAKLYGLPRGNLSSLFK